MGTYTFYVHTDGVPVPSFRIADCPDDEAALEAAARELRSSRTATRVEVVMGERTVATLQRKDPQERRER